jgi:hypothetical protein
MKTQGVEPNSRVRWEGQGKSKYNDENLRPHQIKQKSQGGGEKTP